MPTYDLLASFQRDWKKLTPEQQAAFRKAIRVFVEDLRKNGGFRRSLRVKPVQSCKGVYELTWASDGRATFEIAGEIREGEQHIIWRRIGGHEVIDEA